MMDTDSGPGLCPPANLLAGAAPNINIHLICARRPGETRKASSLLGSLVAALEGAADYDVDGEIKLFELVAYLGKQRTTPPFFIQLAGTDMTLKDLKTDGPTALEKLDAPLLQLVRATGQAQVAEKASTLGLQLQEGLVPVVVTSSHDSVVVGLVSQIRRLGGRFINLVGAKVYAELPHKALVSLAGSHQVWNMTVNRPTESPLETEKKRVAQ